MLSEDDTAHSKRKKHDEFFAKWGFSDYEISDLDQAIVMFILPSLAYFRIRTDSIPSNLLQNNSELQENASFQEWQKIQVNLACFQLYQKGLDFLDSFFLGQTRLDDSRHGGQSCEL